MHRSLKPGSFQEVSRKDALIGTWMSAKNAWDILDVCLDNFDALDQAEEAGHESPEL